MMMRRVLLVAAVAVLGWVGAGWAQTTAPAGPAAEGKTPVEVCFVLDTTGSMTSLIEGAKRKIWSIANEVVAANPKRPMKMGLVAYRDRGDVYITKVVELTDDLDGLYKELMAFKADGGGDTPESVNQALQEAAEKIKWSEVKGATQMIFLVGDAPPHMDYKDDVKYPVTCEAAVKKGLIINTVLCGSDGETRKVWQDIAKKSEGVCLEIAQTGGMAVVSTPMDEKLAKLNVELGKTVVAYGTLAAQGAVSEKVVRAEAMPAEAKAERAKYNVRDGGKAVQGKGDLVFDAAGDKELVSKMADDQLPAEMQKMTVEERKAFVEKQRARRVELNAEIAKVSKEREDYIAAEKKKGEGKGDSFDQAVAEAVREEAGRAAKK